MATEVEVLRAKQEAMADVLKNVDVAINRLSEVANGISKILAVHEERISNFERRFVELSANQETRRSELDREFKDVDKRIELVRKEMSVDFQDLEKTLTDTFKSELKDLKSDVLSSFAAQARNQEEVNHELRASTNRLKTRIESLEKWRWIIMGGAIVVGYLLGNVDLVSILFNR